MHAKLRCDETMNREDQRRRKMEKKEKGVGSAKSPLSLIRQDAASATQTVIYCAT